MLANEVKAEYGDVMERALYNTVLAAMALDGKSFFYVNPLEVFPEACHRDERKAHVRPMRQRWFGCACCPPNLARLISSIASYAFTESPDTLYIHLHISGEVTKQVNGSTAVFHMVSDFPANGTVSVTYTAAAPSHVRLAVRIPGWCGSKRVQAPGHLSISEKDGYCYLSGIWSCGDRAEFDFPMEVKFFQADDRVRETTGRVAVMRGPVVYCAEEADNGKNLHLYKVLPDETVREDVTEIAGNTVLSIRVKALKKVSAAEQSDLYREYSRAQYENTEVVLIPYYAWANRKENEMMVWLYQ